MSVASINGEKPIYEELFYLESDPYEIHNLVSEPANVGIVKHLREKNAQLVKEYRGNKILDTYINKK